MEDELQKLLRQKQKQLNAMRFILFALLALLGVGAFAWLIFSRLY